MRDFTGFLPVFADSGIGAMLRHGSNRLALVNLQWLLSRQPRTMGIEGGLLCQDCDSTRRSRGASRCTPR